MAQTLHGTSQRDHSGIAFRELVEACHDPAVFLQPAKHALDDVRCMVTIDKSAAEQVVCSVEYQKTLEELVQASNIKVESGYTEVFAKLDSSKMARANLGAQEILSFLSASCLEIVQYSIDKLSALSGEEDEEYPGGAEPPSDEKAKTLSTGNYSQGFLLTNLIEYMLANKGQEQLLDYLKVSRVPKAKQYARLITDLMRLKS